MVMAKEDGLLKSGMISLLLIFTMMYDVLIMSF